MLVDPVEALQRVLFPALPAPIHEPSAHLNAAIAIMAAVPPEELVVTAYFLAGVANNVDTDPSFHASAVHLRLRIWIIAGQLAHSRALDHDNRVRSPPELRRVALKLLRKYPDFTIPFLPIVRSDDNGPHVPSVPARRASCGPGITMPPVIVARQRKRPQRS